VTQVLISLGSNVAKETNLPAAVVQLAAQPTVTVLAVSPVLQTAAVGPDGAPSGQPPFHNQALLAETSLAPEELRMLLQEIEAKLGRARTADKFAPRPIDLDLSLYGDFAGVVDGKLLPDPDVMRHAHVALPLAAVAPDWVYGPHGPTLALIAAELAARSGPAAWVASGAHASEVHAAMARAARAHAATAV
jgi:2-amino-4-hydroxy-6-hydroxymethyldihydropteridine diphosphokinase